MLTAARVEAVWPLLTAPPPPHRGYPLFSALCRAGLIFHGQPETIVLPPGGCLVIRCGPDVAGRLTGAGVRRLDVAGVPLWLGAPFVRPVLPSPRLSAWCATIKGAVDDQAFRAAARRQLDVMGVGGRIHVGRRRVVRISGAAVVGYAVRIDRLDADESLVVQGRGVGGRLRMGCGGFLPC